MKKSDWAIAALAVSFLLWAMAMFASPLLPAAETSSMKAIELVIGAASAIATAAAVIVALYFSMRSVRREEELGRLTALRLQRRVEAILERLSWHQGRRLQCRDLESYVQVHIDEARQLADELLHFSDEEITRLSVLGDGVAQRLLTVTARLAVLRRELLRPCITQLTGWDATLKDRQVNQELVVVMAMGLLVRDRLHRVGLALVPPFSEAEKRDLGAHADLL